MSDRKFTDDEVIKALECCPKAVSWGDCQKLGCPASTRQGCRFYLRTDEDHENTIYIEIFKDALALINRQKAEIERLMIDMNAARLGMIAEHERLLTARAEAIKEFAERLKAEMNNCARYYMENTYYIVGYPLIDNLVKEMTEGGGADA